MLDKKSICAVVVTYNRKALLLNCLNGLCSQTYPLDFIVVVDNASTDGTVDFLRQKGWKDNKRFKLITLPENSGGAGGFHYGIKYAYENGFDYVWLMDDDGIPSECCLESLSFYLSDNCYIGPMVLDTRTKDKLSFALRIPNSLEVIDFYSKIPDKLKQNKVIPNIVVPFNGTLISSKLINQMGFPHKEYFVWGDEKEYTIRADKFGGNIFTVIDALFYHPADSSCSTPMFFNQLRFNNSNSDLKLYCFCRNSVAIYVKHHGFFYALLFWFKTLWFFLFTRPSLSKLYLTNKAMWHGLIKDFSHHKEYL